MGRIHFENPLLELKNSGGVVRSTYPPGSPKNWDNHQSLLQCLLYPAFQMAFLKASLWKQPQTLLHGTRVMIILKVSLPCASVVGTPAQIQGEEWLESSLEEKDFGMSFDGKN